VGQLSRFATASDRSDQRAFSYYPINSSPSRRSPVLHGSSTSTLSCLPEAAALAEKPQHKANKNKDQHGAKPYACASAVAPAAVAPVPPPRPKPNTRIMMSRTISDSFTPSRKPRVYATDLIPTGVCSSTSSSKRLRYWIIAVRRSSVLASSLPRRTATPWAER
jgi:hypothetical protein